jgi:predicted RNA-binding Zn-ribbon protein involved in translation (DUF1610 family)
MAKLLVPLGVLLAVAAACLLLETGSTEPPKQGSPVAEPNNCKCPWCGHEFYERERNERAELAAKAECPECGLKYTLAELHSHFKGIEQPSARITADPPGASGADSNTVPIEQWRFGTDKAPPPAKTVPDNSFNF